MPDVLAALRCLGVTLDATDALPYRGIRFLGDGLSVEAAFPDGYGLGVRRTVLHSKMVEAAASAGVRMIWGIPVSAAHQIPRARWIVGADGFHSRVRRWAGLQALPPAPRFGFRIHYR